MHGTKQRIYARFLNIKNMPYSKLHFMYDFIKPKYYWIEFTTRTKVSFDLSNIPINF